MTIIVRRCNDCGASTGDMPINNNTGEPEERYWLESGFRRYTLNPNDVENSKTIFLCDTCFKKETLIIKDILRELGVI